MITKVEKALNATLARFSEEDARRRAIRLDQLPEIDIEALHGLSEGMIRHLKIKVNKEDLDKILDYMKLHSSDDLHQVKGMGTTAYAWKVTKQIDDTVMMTVRPMEGLTTTYELQFYDRTLFGYDAYIWVAWAEYYALGFSRQPDLVFDIQQETTVQLFMDTDNLKLWMCQNHQKDRLHLVYTSSPIITIDNSVDSEDFHPAIVLLSDLKTMADTVQAHLDSKTVKPLSK